MLVKEVAMKSFKWGCLLAVLVVMTGCGEPVMPPTGPLTAVPGERALEGDPWVPSDLWAPLRPLWGDVSGWGQPPGHHAVLAGQCMVDATRACQRPVSPVCRDGDDLGPCNLGFCPGDVRACTLHVRWRPLPLFALPAGVPGDRAGRGCR